METNNFNLNCKVDNNLEFWLSTVKEVGVDVFNIPFLMPAFHRIIMN